MKRHLLLAVSVIMSLSFCFTSFAGWEEGAYGGKKYKLDDGTYVTDRWIWLDDNNDGVAECYCFLFGDTLFELSCLYGGFSINTKGQWTIDGVVQTKPASEIAELNKQISNAPVIQEPEPTSGWMKAGNQGIDKIYKDPSTGINLTGWHELPWEDGGKAWFYFGSDGFLYRNRITPDGYIVDSNGVMFDESVTRNYDWSTTIFGEYGGWSMSDYRCVRDYFNDFPTEEMSFEGFKSYLINLGVEIVSSKQSSWFDDNYFYTGYSYDTKIEIKYKGLHFGISSISPNLSSGSQMWVIK